MKENQRLHLVKLCNMPIFQQLQWEEALLRSDDRNWLIINHGSPPAIVLGISGKLEELVCQTTWNQQPLPLIRRFSGGGTVVVDEETLFVTFICRGETLSFPLYPRSIMEWSAQFYRPLFPNGMFQLQENDYAIGFLKWGGNAQSITRNRYLHHSSILWNYDVEKMKYLLMPKKVPSYREGRIHEEFLCSVNSYFEGRDSFWIKFLEEVSKKFEVVEEGVEELQRIAQLPHRKATQTVYF